jgi:hypothetical protein
MMKNEYCFTGWHNAGDRVYHILTIRRDGGKLVVTEYASCDTEELGNESSRVGEKEAVESDLQKVAFQFINPRADRGKATFDGITVVESLRWSAEHGAHQVTLYFINEDGSDATVEQLRQLVLRHLDDVIAVCAVQTAL